jgi:hypothetical protein
VTQMRAYGAMVVVVETSADRWRLQSVSVRVFGRYPTSPFFGPVVGSNPFGIEGYKTIAFEMLGRADAALQRAAEPLGGHGLVCREYGLPGRRDLQLAVGMGSRCAGTPHLDIHNPAVAGQKRRTNGSWFSIGLRTPSLMPGVGSM